MKKLIALIISFLIAMALRGQGLKEHKVAAVNQTAIQFNDSAVAIISQPYDSFNYSIALSLLETAIRIDSNFYVAYWNKLSVESQLRKYKQAIETGMKLIAFNPREPQFYGLVGSWYFRIGDSVSSTKYYNQAVILYDQALDTIDTNKIEFKLFKVNRAAILIMLNRSEEAHEILRQMQNIETDEVIKNLIEMVLDKTPQQIYDYLNKY